MNVKGSKTEESQGKAQEETGTAKPAAAEKPAELNGTKDSKPAQAAASAADSAQDKKPTEDKKTPDKTKAHMSENMDTDCPILSTPRRSGSHLI